MLNFLRNCQPVFQSDCQIVSISQTRLRPREGKCLMKSHMLREQELIIKMASAPPALSSDFTTIYLTVTLTLMSTLPLLFFPHHPAANPLTLVLPRGLRCHIGIKLSSAEWFTSSLPSGSAVANRWITDGPWGLKGWWPLFRWPCSRHSVCVCVLKQLKLTDH